MANEIYIALIVLASVGVFANVPKDYYDCFNCENTFECNQEIIMEDTVQIQSCSINALGCYTAIKGKTFSRGCANNLTEIGMKIKIGGWNITRICGEDKCNGDQRNFPELECYQCDDCKEPGKQNTASVKCESGPPEVCYTREKKAGDNVEVIRGCIETANLGSIIKDVTDVCIKQKCNNKVVTIPESFTCVEYSDSSSLQPKYIPAKEKDVKCTTKNLGCYTKIEDGFVYRGCLKDEAELKEWQGEGQRVLNLCKEYKCNNEKIFECLSCKDDNCNIPEITLTDFCTGKDKGCYTLTDGDKMARGCATNETEFPSGIVSKFCDEDTCNNLRAFRCFKCEDKACHNEITIKTEYCTNENIGCYTQHIGDKIKVGCAKDQTEWESLKVQGAVLSEPCKNDKCNDKIPPNYYMCWKCENEHCNNFNTTEYCGPENVGCFTQLEGSGMKRGCAKDEKEWKELNRNSRILGPCKKDHCNDEKVHDCYACHNNKECRNPEKYNIATVKCPAEKQFVGCYNIFANSTTIRNCAQSKEQIDALMKAGYELQKTCKTAKCNREINKNSSLRILGSPALMFFLVFITAYFVC